MSLHRRGSATKPAPESQTLSRGHYVTAVVEVCARARHYRSARIQCRREHAKLGRALGSFDRSDCGLSYTDLDAKIVRYRGAGHPPLLLSSRSNDDARSIEQNGLFLGMFPEAAYSSLEIPLRPGDRYVLYTDGQPDPETPRAKNLALARCKQFLESHPRPTAAALADAILGEIAHWSARSSGRLQEET